MQKEWLIFPLIFLQNSYKWVWSCLFVFLFPSPYHCQSYWTQSAYPWFQILIVPQPNLHPGCCGGFALLCFSKDSPFFWLTAFSSGTITFSFRLSFAFLEGEEYCSRLGVSFPSFSKLEMYHVFCTMIQNMKHLESNWWPVTFFYFVHNCLCLF